MAAPAGSWAAATAADRIVTASATIEKRRQRNGAPLPKNGGSETGFTQVFLARSHRYFNRRAVGGRAAEMPLQIRREGQAGHASRLFLEPVGDDGSEIGAADAGRLPGGDPVAAVGVAALGDEGANAFDVVGARFQHDEAAHDAVAGLEIGGDLIVGLAPAAILPL